MTDWRRVFRQVAPHANSDILEGVLATVDDVFSKRRINTVARQSDFLAHVVVESQGLTRTEENLNYSAAGLLKTFPTHFNAAQAQECAHHPRQIALRAYGGRMGNRVGTEDGWTYRGSGLLQCTGAANMKGGARVFGITVSEYADRLRDPEHALECAAELYVRLGALPYADQGNIEGSTKVVNGGKNGLSERIRFRNALRVAIPKAYTGVRAGLMDAVAADAVIAEDAAPAEDDAVGMTDEPSKAPKSMATSKVSWTTVTAGASSIGVAATAVQPIIESAQTAKDTATQAVGLFSGVDTRLAILGVLTVVIVAACVFIWIDRRHKLYRDGV